MSRPPLLPRVALLCLAGSLALAPSAGSADPPPRPLDPKDVPAPLKPWVPWVMHGQDAALCPTPLGAKDGARCAFPARLTLRLDDRGGQFAIEWHVRASGWYALPGDAKRWPQDVTVNRGPAAVVEREGVPHLQLRAGDYQVAGRFQWDSLPESLRVPPDTGLFALHVKGQLVARPNRQPDGVVFLQKESVTTEDERLEIVVHRKVSDETPLLLTTRVTLNVAGKRREVVLGRALPAGFVPMSLDSALPARLEPDSRLRVQVRPGTFTITLTARSAAPVAELRRPQVAPPPAPVGAPASAPTLGGPWRVGEEIWVFEAQPALRLVSVEGVSAVDPQQTSLPDDWKRLPAYPMGLGDTMRLVEKRRGDAEPAAERLTLARILWLDFGGRGFTVSDTITGALKRAVRLEMTPPLRLGRVSLAGRDQFITHLGDQSRTGVELRPGPLSLTADSRLEVGPTSIPAVGWDRGFHQVSATLNLPPGWRLLHAGGVDEVRGTWLRHWTLLEIFLALVLALGVWRLRGTLWAGLALVTFVLVFPEPGAPRWVFVAVLALEALVRALHEGRLQKVLRVFAHGTAVILVLVTIPFLVGHVRAGLYPALEAPGARGAGLFGAPRRAQIVSVVAAPSAANVDEDFKQYQKAYPLKLRGKGEGKEQAARQAWSQFNVEEYDPHAVVQTGPGRPSWSWHSFDLRWSGPVEARQSLHLYVTSPAVNLVLALLRAALLVALVLALVPWRWRGRLAAAPAAVTALLFLALQPAPAHAQLPPGELLGQLGERLRAPPECRPGCAAVPRLLLEAEGRVLRLRLEVTAAAATAVPLPGNAAQWLPERVLVDGKPARGVARDTAGTLWLLVEPGRHQVLAEGSLPEQEAVQLALPAKPHRVESRLRGWSLDGVREDGVPEESLTLSRVAESRGARSLQPGVLPPFVRVERTLRIGLNWQVETRLVRVTPPGTPVALEVPLLKGESVTSAEIRVAGGKVQVSLGPQEKEVAWRSVLAEVSPVVLTAPPAAAWTEVWRLDLAPLWHAVPQGLPAVHPAGDEALPEWRPWPGESLRVELSRPAGVAGQTVTIDESTLAVTPGVRSADVRLTFVVRSSRGAQHTLTLPPGASPESLLVDGKSQPLRQVGRQVTLSLVPGRQTVTLTWSEPRGASLLYRVAPADLGAPSVNASTELRLSNNRWTLFVGGPRLGPAVLFWSLLAALLVLGVLLGRIRLVPLRAWHWMLLLVGLSQVHLALAAVVVAWLLLLGWRARSRATDGEPAPRFWFNARQVLIPFSTLLALGVLVGAVHAGLLGQPDMQIDGNGSGAGYLRWFEDRAASTPAAPFALSVSLWIYRLAMLAWSLWLAIAVLGWLRWGWGAFGGGGFWRPGPPTATPPRSGIVPPPASAGQPPLAGYSGPLPPYGPPPSYPYGGPPAYAPPVAPGYPAAPFPSAPPTPTAPVPAAPAPAAPAPVSPPTSGEPPTSK
jgi:hypothetical protein